MDGGIRQSSTHPREPAPEANHFATPPASTAATLTSPSATSEAPASPSGFWHKERHLSFRWLNATLLAALAACFLFELAYGLTVVVQRPFGPLIYRGYSISQEWVRLTGFVLFLLVDAALLTLGAIRIRQQASQPLADDDQLRSRWRRRSVAIAVSLSICTFVFLVLTTQFKSGRTGLLVTRTLTGAAIGVALAMTVLSLIMVFRAPRILRRGPNRVGWFSLLGYLAVSVVLVGVPFAATSIDPPTNVAPMSTGFASLVKAPSPRIISAAETKCDDTEHCVAVGLVAGLEFTFRFGIVTTSDGGREWHSALLPKNTQTIGHLTCAGATCWTATKPTGKTGLAVTQIKIRGTGRPAMTVRSLPTPPDTFQLPDTACWSMTECLALGKAAPKFRAQSGAAPIAEYTSDGGKTWTVSQLPLPPGATEMAQALDVNQGLWCDVSGSCLAGGEVSSKRCATKTFRFSHCPNALVLLRSGDGGMTWTSWVPFPRLLTGGRLLCTARPTCLANDSVSSSHQTFSLSTNTGVSWGASRPFGPGTVHVACSSARCVRVRRSGTNTTLISTSSNGGKKWSAGFIHAGAATEATASCGASGRCIVGFEGAPIPTSSPYLTPRASASIAFSGPTEPWIVTTVPRPAYSK